MMMDDSSANEDGDGPKEDGDVREGALEGFFILRRLYLLSDNSQVGHDS